MPRLNCWEFKHCGRQVGGPAVDKLGVCPAASATQLEGINHGKAGGRACWAIAGTLCGGVVQGSFAQKLASCLNCEFYRAVVREEGRKIATARTILEALEGGAKPVKGAPTIPGAHAFDPDSYTGARDFIVQSFFDAQQDGLGRSKLDADRESLLPLVEAAVRGAFHENGDDFDRPNLASLRRVVDTLMRKARRWGAREETIAQHEQEIERLLQRLR